MPPRAFACLALLTTIPVAASAETPPQVHMFAFALPACIEMPKGDTGNWVHNQPCKPTDLGWIDRNHIAHFTEDRAALQAALAKMLAETIGLPIEAETTP
jgi:hypothetical protein